MSDLSARAQELLCYLLLHRDRAHTREALSELLWPEVSCAQSKKYLRQTLWQLQAVLESPAMCEQPEAEALLILDPGWVRLNLLAVPQMDVATFEQAFVACRDIPDQNLTDSQAQRLVVAANLYQGDLLETWYQDWCIYERERLQLTYLAMLEKLMGYYEACQRYAEGLVYGQAILRYDPARECTHRRLMRLHYKDGDRTGALRQFERCASALAKEFNLQPSHETLALYEQIRADRIDDLAHERTEGQAARLAEAEPWQEFSHLYQRLDQIQACLVNIQNQLQQELLAIRLAAKNGVETLQQTPR